MTFPIDMSTSATVTLRSALATLRSGTALSCGRGNNAYVVRFSIKR